MANEKRLIDANVVRCKINAFAASVVYRGNAEMFTGKDTCNLHEYTRGYEKGVLDATNIVMGQEPMDAVEVVHGQWETHNQVDSVFYCSECKLNVSGFERRWLNYCPNCGANMMDGD